MAARAVSDGSTGSFATSYTLVLGQDATASCAQLKLERVGLQKYFSQEPNAKDSVAIRVDRVGVELKKTTGSAPQLVLDPDAPHQPSSVGP